jgi:NADH-quinone oxidoreductase subunit N
MLLLGFITHFIMCLNPYLPLWLSPVAFEFVERTTGDLPATMTDGGSTIISQVWAAMISSLQMQTYSGLLAFAALAVFLCIALAGLAYVFSLAASQDTEKRSEYECGFAPFDSATRHPFEVHFYVVGILFLIFDVEIALLFPWVLTVEASGVFSYLMMFQFVYILAVGFHYEWKRGALIWPARYSPSRLTVASAKWFSFLLLIFVTDLPVELLLLAPAVGSDVKKEKEKDTIDEDPADAGAKFKRIEKYKYTPIYGPHPENSPYHIFWAAREDACRPVFGPLAKQRPPHLDVVQNLEQTRRDHDWQRHHLLQQTEVTVFLRSYARRRWLRRLWWTRRAPYNDKKRLMLKNAPIWKRVFIYLALFVLVFLVLLALSLVWEAIAGDFHKNGKRAFFALLVNIQNHFSTTLPTFNQWERITQITFSLLMMGPWFVVRYAITHWESLAAVALIYTRLITFAFGRGSRAKVRRLWAVKWKRDKWFWDWEDWIASRGGVEWEKIPSKFHPDKGRRDEQHDEYVMYTGATNRRTWMDNWSSPFMFALLSVDEANYFLSALYPVANYGRELLVALLPELVLMAMVIYLIKVVGIELGRGRLKKALAIESLAAAQEGMVFVVWLYLLQIHFVETTAVLSGYFFWTSGIIVSKFFVAVTSLFITCASENFVRHNVRHLLEYPIMLLLAILLLLCLVGANNLITMFLCIGGFSICLYVLILFDVYARITREAAMKYFYLSAMSAGLIIFGTFLLYSATGTSMFSDLRWAFLSRADINPITSSIGLAFIILGLFFKLSAFPAHLWAVEVYEGSPAPVMAFFLLPIKMAVLLVFVRALNTAFIGLAYLWLPCVSIACAGSLLWGAFAALYERKISRFLGYASINQLGYLLLNIACDTDEAMRALYIYLLLYVIMSGGFLFVYMHARRKGRLGLLYISDFRGFAVQERVLSWSLTVFLFSSVGIPPLVGFHAKYIVLVAAMQKELFLLAGIGIAVGLLSAYYYLQFVTSFQFEEQNRVIPARCALSEDERLTVSYVEAALWISPFLGPTILPVFQVIAEAASVCAAADVAPAIGGVTVSTAGSDM